MPYNPAWWGPPNGIDSKDYILHMEGPNGPTDVPVNLLGHGLTSPNQNLTDPVTFFETVLRNGKVRTVSRTKRAAYETSRTYTVGFPSALWTPLMQKSIIGGCTTNLFLYYQCPDDEIYNHVDILPSATLNPAIEAEDVITVNEDTNIITFTSELQVPEKVREWALGYDVIYDPGGTVALRDIAIMTEDCPGCEFVAGQGVIVIGSDGTAVPLIVTTDDRFTTTDTQTGYGIATDAAVSVATEGDDVIVALKAAGADPAGKLYVSHDRGVSATLVSGFTAVINRIVKLGNTYIAVGEQGGAGTAARVYVSEDRGNSWTQVTASAIVALSTQPIWDAAVDPATGKIYMVASGGKVLSARLAGSGLAVSDISANVGTGDDMFAVAVLGKNHVVIGGEAGTAFESRDGGATWAILDIPGTDAIHAIAGNFWRTLIGAGAKVYERSLMTKNAVQEIALEGGIAITGDITRIVMGLEENFNLFFVVTDDGETIIGRGHYPNA